MTLALTLEQTFAALSLSHRSPTGESAPGPTNCTDDIVIEDKSPECIGLQGHEELLKKVVAGEDVEEHVEDLASVLDGNKPVTFDDFTVREQLASALLLLACWHNKDMDNAYLKQLLYCIPYALPYLDRVIGFDCSLEDAIKAFTAAPNEVYTQTDGKKFLTKMHELLYEPPCLDVTIDELVDVLACWLKQYDRPSIEIARAVYNLSYFYNSERGKLTQTSCNLIAELAKKTHNYTEALQVLHAFNSKEPSLLAWFEGLSKGPICNLALQLVSSMEFPKFDRRRLVDHLLRPEASDSALHLAVMLTPSLDAETVQKVLSRLNSVPEPTIEFINSIRCFFKNVTRAHYPIISGQILHMPQMLAILEDTAFKYPMAEYPCALFIHTIRSEQFPKAERDRLIEMYMSSDASTHTLTLALKLASDDDHKRLHEICDRITSKNEPIQGYIVLTANAAKACGTHLKKESILYSRLRYIKEKKKPPRAPFPSI